MVTTDLEVVPGHIETPDSIELKASAVASPYIGAWSLWPIVKDTVFGPFVGDIKKGKDVKDINYRYAWEVFDLETFGLLHVIDATDPSKGNWMRYVNCARYLEEQNIISLQQEDQVYYKAIKNIEPGEELLTWFEPRKKMRGHKRKIEKEIKEAKVSATTTDPSDAEHDKDDDSLGKRKRKPKVFPDSYQEIQLPQQKKLNKVHSSDSSQSETSTNMVVKGKQKKMKESSDELKESKDDTESATSSRCSSVIPEKKDIFNNNSVSWDYPKPGEEYMFELKKHHVVKVEGKNSYKCDICSGLYRHKFSLKRHYLKNHINYQYLGRTDVTNCLINLAQVLEAEKAAMTKRKFEELGVGKENFSSNDAASDSGIASSVNCVSSEGDNFTDLSSNDDLQLENKVITSVIEDDKKNSLHETGVESLDDDIRNSVRDGISVSSETNQNSSTVKDDNCQEKGVSDSKNSEIVQRPGLYRCYLCFEHFETVAEIREHTVNHPESKTHMTFACNKCEMRFSNIQNLVRHQAVHQANGSELINQSKKLLPGKGAKKMRRTTSKDILVDENTDIKTEEETNEEMKNAKCGPKECIGNDQKGKSSKSPENKYHCSRCSQKFGFLQNLLRHQEVHKDEKKTSPHSCEYCGKGFPSLSNLKKHVRFHLGYRMNCLYCGDIHKNVGGLRKHIRIAHPEVHKAKLKNKLAKDGVLRKPDRKVVDKKSKASKIKDGVTDPTEKMAADKQKNLEIKKKKDTTDELFSDNEISFAAEEIDDGVSRFKFACTICKRRFSSHISMSRHRHKSHDNESKHRSKASNSVRPVVTETPEMVALFYANVANNVAINMTKYIDGGQNSLQNCIDHIKIEDYDEHPTRQEKSADMSWDRYNVPFDITVNEASCDNRSPGECTFDICNQLQQVVAQQKLRNTSNRGDNYDDEQLSGSDDSSNSSPLDDFENIAFGKHGNITCVCGVCRKQFQDLDCLELHHFKKHPSVAFNFLEVEQGNGIDLLHYSEPSNVGVLAVTNTGLESATERDIYQCTGCGSVFKNVSRLHVHIVNCVSTSNPSNSSDLNKSKKKKTSLKSNIMKKQGEIMNGSQNFQSRLKDFARHKAEIFNIDGKQRKRIFTGCRKRKAVSLPDSPVKLNNKDHDETGYNPNNHIRRRELTELLDTHQCSGCGVKFMTILLLERHVKICDKKEKFKELHPLKSWRSPLLEISTHASNVVRTSHIQRV